MSESETIIEGGYLRNILDQPSALERSVAALAEDRELRALGERLRGSRYRQVVLTGMGSSFHALHPLWIELAGLGTPAMAVETSELIHYCRSLLAPGTLMIVLSQSGRSAETLRLIERNAGKSWLVAVTNDPDSPLAAAAQASVFLNASAEYSVSTKTYLTSLAALAWLGDYLTGGDPRRSREALRLLAPAAASYLGRWKEHTARARSELEGVERLYYAGRGPSLATAGVAGLTTKEAARFPAEGMSAAAFRHGPLEMVDGRTFVLAFEGDPRTAGLNARLVEDVRRAGGRAALVSEAAAPDLFHIPPVPGRLRPVIEILPVQMITLALAAMAGREAGVFTRASKVTLTE